MSLPPSLDSGIRRKVALVIGASGGIGEAVVLALLTAGAGEVIAASRRPALPAHAGVTPWQVDVTSTQSVAAAAKEFGERVDFVVNCSGVNSNLRLEQVSEQTAQDEMDVNYFGLIRVFREFAPFMRARGQGTFVNVLSVVAHVNHPRMATYSASKAAAYSVTQAMRAELAPFGIRVYAMLPPSVDTRMSAHLVGPKLSPAQFAQDLVNAMRGDMEDVYPGAATQLHEALQRDWKAVERDFASRLRPAGGA